MIDRRAALALLAAATVHAQSSDHVTWVADILKRMETIKTGATRETLLKVFNTEGGISSRFQRTYVSRECPYFKVDVVFDATGRTSPNEDPRDIVTKISRPYLQFGTGD